MATPLLKNVTKGHSTIIYIYFLCCTLRYSTQIRFSVTKFIESCNIWLKNYDRTKCKNQTANSLFTRHTAKTVLAPTLLVHWKFKTNIHWEKNCSLLIVGQQMRQYHNLLSSSFIYYICQLVYFAFNAKNTPPPNNENIICHHERLCWPFRWPWR